jgi:hypothetical protein
VTTSRQLVDSSPTDMLAARRYDQIEQFLMAFITSETILPRQED